MKKPFRSLSLLIIGACLSACYDTQYEKIEDYYDFFDDTVYLCYFDEAGTSESTTSVSLGDHFYNEDTANDFKEDDLVDSEYYSYLAVCLDADESQKFGDLCLYFRGEEAAVLEIRFFIVDDLPSDMRGYNDPAKKEKGGSYNDNLSNPCATVTTEIKKGKFSNIFVSEWTIGGNKQSKFELEPDQYLFIQFVNNTGYGKDLNLKNVKFTMTNLIVGKTSK